MSPVSKISARLADETQSLMKPSDLDLAKFDIHD
jgi:hypothetical protein